MSDEFEAMKRAGWKQLYAPASLEGEETIAFARPTSKPAFGINCFAAYSNKTLIAIDLGQARLNFYQGATIVEGVFLTKQELEQILKRDLP